ncbi:hypothetical protein SDC9_142170 [bioreactor metagenome]|uniref:Uncharacterized protein n=1 Tax=bioreactor metagenome TaxID=1076179 RepID=A0A645E0D9_9ZZZZ
MNDNAVIHHQFSAVDFKDTACSIRCTGTVKEQQIFIGFGTVITEYQTFSVFNDEHVAIKSRCSGYGPSGRIGLYRYIAAHGDSIF